MPEEIKIDRELFEKIVASLSDLRIIRTGHLNEQFCPNVKRMLKKEIDGIMNTESQLAALYEPTPPEED